LAAIRQGADRFAVAAGRQRVQAEYRGTNRRANRFFPEPLASKGSGLCPRELHVRPCCDALSMSGAGLVSRVSPVHTALRNCTRDEGRSFEVGNQVLISNHRKLLWSKATVVNVAEKPEQDSGRYD
jgi:hypothetical protein